MKKRTLAGVLAVLVLAGAGVALYVNGSTRADDVADDTVKAADTSPLDPAAVARGKYVAQAADCAACHTAAGSTTKFSGGYELHTPFGSIFATNITPDRKTGIGNWTERDFFHAVRHGRSPHGLLYPAMPYNAYVKLSDGDMHDLWAYMRSVPAVSNKVDGTHLPFPYNIRASLAGWNLLFFRNEGFAADPHASAEINRGRYLVEGAGHCASCHTAKNSLGGDSSDLLQGGTLQGWFAPELSGNQRVGIGAWSDDEAVAYLKTGSNAHAVASGPMAEAVEHSTQHMTEADLKAMAVYLKSLPGSPASTTAAIAANDPVMVRGAQVYTVNCMACHDQRGEGVKGMVSAFAGNPNVQQKSPDSIVLTLLNGGRAAVTEANPTGAGMPSFAWKLNDEDAAAVLTYVRNSWGNAASAVTPTQVGEARKTLRSGEAFTHPAPN